MGGKLFLVQGLDVGGMAEAALDNRLRPTVLPAERGSILDANGTVLANSVIRYNITVDQTVNTQDMNPSSGLKRWTARTSSSTVTRDQGIAELAAAPWSWTPPMSANPSRATRTYYIVAKDLRPHVENRVSDLQIPGIFSEGTSKRVYPNGSVAGGIVGFLENGTTGQAGLEQTQDGILRGTPASVCSKSAPTASGSPWAWTN